MRRLATAVAAALLTVGVIGLASPASADDGAVYAPVDRPGPKLRPSKAELAAAVTCKGNFRNGKEPVLLVAGTAFDYQAQFAWSWAAALTRARIPWCAVSSPYDQMGDASISGEYDAYAIRHTYRRAGGRKIAIIGHSQGGAQPRWALRFFPDTRRMVADMVGVAPANQGGTNLNALGAVCSTVSAVKVCPEAIWQFQPESRYIAALNSRRETFRGIDYTVIYSRTDGIVQTADTVLDAGPGVSYRRVAIQSICPGRLADHFQNGATDAATWAMAMDAITHRGPLDPSRVDRKACNRLFLSGMSPLTAVNGLAGAVVQIAKAIAAAPKSSEEPRLPSYVYR